MEGVNGHAQGGTGKGADCNTHPPLHKDSNKAEMRVTKDPPLEILDREGKERDLPG